MDRYKLLITGGTPLRGETCVFGGKNTSVAVLPATLLCDEPCVVENLPDIEDVHVVRDMLELLGAVVDYDRANRRMQDVKEAVAVEVRTSLLNPVFIKERMKGDEGTAQMFGEMFRNIFGWSATRPDALDKDLYNDLYRLYVADEQQLGVRRYFQQVNPAAYQAMTSVMLESARKGFWKPSADQLKALAQLHAEITAESGAACTDFVCNNEKLQKYVTNQLQGQARTDYQRSMDAAKLGQSGQKEMVLKEKNQSQPLLQRRHVVNGLLIGAAFVAGLVLLIVYLRRRR